MKYFIASDHAGFDAKSFVISFLKNKNIDVVDLGTNDSKSVDYADYAHSLAKNILKNKDSFGVLICGTGIGMCMTANKHKGIRAALCHDVFTAKMARQHNNANVLCFGQRVVNFKDIGSIIESWLQESFEGGRHDKRVLKIDEN